MNVEQLFDDNKLWSLCNGFYIYTQWMLDNVEIIDNNIQIIKEYHLMTQTKIHRHSSRPYNSMISSDALLNAQKSKNQQLILHKQPIPKPTQDKAADNRSQSLNSKTHSQFNSHSQLHSKKNINKNQQSRDSIDRYRQGLEVYQNQMKKLAKLLGNQNMNFQQIKSEVEDLILNRSYLKQINEGKLSQRAIQLPNEMSQHSKHNINLPTNQVSRQFLKDLQEEIMRKSKMIQDVASSINYQPPNYISKIEDQASKVRKSSSSLKQQLQKKGKHIQDLNRQLQREKIRYETLNKSYQAYKITTNQDQQKSIKGIWYQGIVKTPQQLIKQLISRDQLILQKTNRIYQLEDQIKKLKLFIQQLKQQNRILKQQLTKNYIESQKQLQKNSILKYSFINPPKQPHSKTSIYRDITNQKHQLNPIYQSNMDSYQISKQGSKKQFNNPFTKNPNEKQKKSLFFRQPVVSQNIIDPKYNQYINLNDKNSHMQSINSINNSSLLHKIQQNQNQNKLQNPNINFSYPNNSQKSKKQISKIDFKSQVSINPQSITSSKPNINPQNLISQMNLPFNYQHSSSKAFPFNQQEYIQYPNYSLSNIHNFHNDLESIQVEYRNTKKQLSKVSLQLEDKKKILSQVLDKAKSVDLDIKKYWQRVSERQNSIKEQYQNQIQKLQKKFQLLQLQNNLAQHRIEQIKKQKQIIQLSFHQNQSQPVIINTMKSLQSQINQTKKQYIKLKAQLISQQQNSKKQISSFKKIVHQLNSELNNQKQKCQQLKSQKIILLERNNKSYKSIKQFENKYQSYKQIYIDIKNDQQQFTKRQLESRKKLQSIHSEVQKIYLLQSQRQKIKYQYEQLNSAHQQLLKNNDIVNMNYKQIQQQLNNSLQIIQNLKKIIKQKQEDINLLKLTIQDLKKQNQIYERQSKSLQQQYQAFRFALHQQKDKIQQSLNNKLQQTSTNFQELLQQSNKLRIAQVMQVRADSQHKEQIINELINQKNILMNQFNILKNLKNEQQQEFIEKIFNLQQNIKHLQTELSNFRQEVPILQNNHKILLANLSQNQKDKFNLKQQLKLFQRELSQIKGQLIPKLQRDLQFQTIQNKKITQMLKINQNQYNLISVELRQKNQKIIQLTSKQSGNIVKHSQLQQNNKAANQKLNWIAKQLEDKNKIILELSNKNLQVNQLSKQLMNQLDMCKQFIQSQRIKNIKTADQIDFIAKKRQQQLAEYKKNITQILHQNSIYNRNFHQSYNNLLRYLTTVFKIQLVPNSPQHSKAQITDRNFNDLPQIKTPNTINKQIPQQRSSLTDSQTSFAKRNNQVSINTSIKKIGNESIKQIPPQNLNKLQSNNFNNQISFKAKHPQQSYSKTNILSNPLYYKQHLATPYTVQKSPINQYQNVYRSTSEKLLNAIGQKKINKQQPQYNIYQKNQYGQSIRREQKELSKELINGNKNSSGQKRSKTSQNFTNRGQFLFQYQNKVQLPIQYNKIPPLNKDQKYSYKQPQPLHSQYVHPHFNKIPNVVSSTPKNSLTSSGIFIHQIDNKTENQRGSTIYQKKQSTPSNKNFFFNKTSIKKTNSKNDEYSQTNKSRVDPNNVLSESQQSGLHLHQKVFNNNGGCCIDL